MIAKGEVQPRGIKEDRTPPTAGSVRLHRVGPAPAAAATSGEAEYWRMRYQEERERLAKLWVAYKQMEAQVDQLRRRSLPTPQEQEEIRAATIHLATASSFYEERVLAVEADALGPTERATR